MARKKMYQSGSIIESFDELEEIFKVSDFVMMDCGVRGDPKWMPKHKMFVVSMPYHVVKSRLKRRAFSVAIKN